MGVAAIVIYYCAITGVFALRKNTLKYAVIAVLIAANGFLCMDIFNEHAFLARICAFDVGQGDAFLAEFPGHRTCLSMPGRPTGLLMQEIDLLPLISNEREYLH